MPDKPIKDKVVYVEWIDSTGGGSAWELRRDLDDFEPLQCKSVGLVLEETSEYLTLAMSTTEFSVMGALTIPKVVITKVKTLR